MKDVVTMTLISGFLRGVSISRDGNTPRDRCFHLSCKKTDVAMKDRTGYKKLIG